MTCAAPLRIDIECFRGASYEATFQLRSGGTPIPHAGWTFSGDVRRKDNGGKLFDILFTPIDDYRVRVSVAPETTEAVNVIEGRYRWMFRSPLGVVRPARYGLWLFDWDANG